MSLMLRTWSLVDAGALAVQLLQFVEAGTTIIARGIHRLDLAAIVEGDDGRGGAAGQDGECGREQQGGQQTGGHRNFPSDGFRGGGFYSSRGATALAWITAANFRCDRTSLPVSRPDGGASSKGDSMSAVSTSLLLFLNLLTPAQAAQPVPLADGRIEIAAGEPPALPRPCPRRVAVARPGGRPRPRPSARHHARRQGVARDGAGRTPVARPAGRRAPGPAPDLQRRRRHRTDPDPHPAPHPADPGA